MSNRLLTASMVAISIVLCVLLRMIFLPSDKQTQAQGAMLSVAPNPVSAGETLQVNGFEYPATAKVEIYFQNRANGVVHATANKGGFFTIPLTLPKQYIDGAAYLYAVNDNITARTELHFSRPTVAYHPPARRSTIASFKGAGFVAHESINYVLIAGDNTIKGTQTTDGQGRFTVALKLPDMPLNSQATFMANDKLEKSVFVKALYTPLISLSSFVGAANTTLNITGRGYKNKESVSILFQGKQVALVSTDQKGTFSNSFKIPTSANATSYYNDIQAIGLSSKATTSDSFQVTPSISSVALTAVPGQNITVTGSQFTPQKHVQVVLFSPSQGASGVGTVLQNIVASSSGSFRVTFSVPRNIVTRKVYSIVYIDVASGHNLNTNLKVT